MLIARIVSGKAQILWGKYIHQCKPKFFFSTARKVKVMKTQEWYLILKNSHFKTMKFVQRVWTKSDKKPTFQVKIFVCETLQRHKQAISNS